MASVMSSADSLPYTAERPLRLSTRSSRLAILQARRAEARLREAFAPLEPDAIRVAPLAPASAAETPSPDATGGLKGGLKDVFAAGPRREVLEGRADLAVHSMKDLPGAPCEGLRAACASPRDAPEDALLFRRDDPLMRGARRLADVPLSAAAATSSPRRVAQFLALGEGRRTQPLRGNVTSRARRVRDREARVAVLALCGLRRLGIGDEDDSELKIAALSTDDVLPAAGQGAIAVECRRDDEACMRILDRLEAAYPDEAIAQRIERAALRALDGTCDDAVAMLARKEADGRFRLRAAVYSSDGRRARRLDEIDEIAEAGVSLERADEFGADAGRRLRERLDDDILVP